MTGNDKYDAERETAAEVAEARRQRDAALTRLRHLENSTSYRIGRIATWLPRRLRSRRDATSTIVASNVATTASAAENTSPMRRAPRNWTPSPRTQHPDVSVVIPVYNSAPWLEDCLASVLAQTDVTLEVICVDDGSTDESRDILRRVAEMDQRIVTIEQPNSGQSVARNHGLDMAAGRYIVFLDSDDYWQDDALSTLVTHADSLRLDLLLFDSCSFLDGEVSRATWERYSTYYQRSQEYGETRTGIQMLADMRRRRDYRPHVGLYLARAEYVRKIRTRFIPGIVHQDNPYTFSLMLHADRVAHVQSEIYARRIRPGSTITSLNDIRSATGYYLSYLSMMRELGTRTLPPAVMGMTLEVVHGVFQGAQQKIAYLTPGEMDQLRSLDSQMDAQLILEAMRSANPRPNR